MRINNIDPYFNEWRKENGQKEFINNFACCLFILILTGGLLEMGKQNKRPQREHFV